MQVCHLIAFVCVATQAVYGQGAGRAIPIATENFVINLFRRINSNIEYDTSNFLVDLSGNYANCNSLRKSLREIGRLAPDGASIAVIQDFTFGAETHTKAVDGYLRPVFEDWVFDNGVPGAYEQIRNADKFGCSVRPGCLGDQVSVACLFSPSRRGRVTTRRPQPPPQSTPRPGEQKAKAFTVQQYDKAEGLTKQMWDRSHFLENLSGFETRCDMMFRGSHEFPYAKSKAQERGKDVVGLFGWARNQGDTEVAMIKILKDMKQDTANMFESEIGRLAGFFDPAFADPQITSKHVGCSLIPDCMTGPQYNREMWVVVSCIFEV